MRLITLAALAAIIATPASAEWVPPKTYEPPKDNGFTPIFGQGQKQGQAQQQGQAQGQQQTAHGGAGGAGGTGGDAASTAAASESAINQGVNISNTLSSRNMGVKAPTVNATGDCQRSVSLALGLSDGGGGFGFTYDQQWCVMLELVKTYVALGMPARIALYTACDNRRSHRSLMLYGVRCDLNGDALIAYEASLRPVAVEVPAPPRRAKAPRRPSLKRTPVPKPAPVDCRPTPAPICPVS